MPFQNQAELYLANLASTQKFGQYIGQIIPPNTILTLSGEIGSGKTTLVKSIAKALHIEETVTSPTFVMMNEYHSGRLPLYHLDLYRLIDQSDKEIPLNLLNSQLEEVLNTNSVIFIEWAKVLSNHYQEDLSNLSNNGFLDLNLAAPKDNNESRILTLTLFGKSPSTAFSLFADLANCQKIL